MACLLCSGGNKRAGAPVLCLLPCLNGSGSLRARSKSTEHLLLGEFATNAPGVDPRDKMLTPDTKLHALSLDRALDVPEGHIKTIKEYTPLANTFEEKVSSSLKNKSVVPKETS